jgi:hypothetical protein
MARKRRSAREMVSDNFLMAFADSFEKGGVEALRKVMEDDPTAFRRLPSRVLHKEDVDRLGPNPSDEILSLIADVIVKGIRHGTAAQGKPSPKRLN